MEAVPVTRVLGLVRLGLLVDFEAVLVLQVRLRLTSRAAHAKGSPCRRGDLELNIVRLEEELGKHGHILNAVGGDEAVVRVPAGCFFATVRVLQHEGRLTHSQEQLAGHSARVGRLAVDHLRRDGLHVLGRLALFADNENGAFAVARPEVPVSRIECPLISEGPADGAEIENDQRASRCTRE